MNRRNFVTLTAGTLFGDALLSGEQSQSQQKNRTLKFTLRLRLNTGKTPPSSLPSGVSL